jgi:integrase
MKVDSFTSQLWPTLALTKASRKNYEGAYRRYLSPQVGQKEMLEVSKNDLVTALSTLPPQTRYQTLMTARVIWREALERELVITSPAATIKTPKITVKQQKFLTWEELQKIDFGTQTKRIRFLALHGLRYGEAAALTEDDIHDGVVHITKSRHGLTKTTSGVRNVPLLSDFVPFAQCQKSVAQALKPYGVTVHSLRRTYAYTLKSARIHVTTAAKLMGHSNPMMTLKIYTSVLDDEIDAAGEVLLKKIKL